MDNLTIAILKRALGRYEQYLAGEPVNVINPDGSTPSRKQVEMEVKRLRETLAEEGALK